MVNNPVRVSRGLVPICCILILASFCVVPAWASDAAVSREIDRSSIPVGGEVLVTLAVGDLGVGGVVETIPEGFVFLETSFPEDRYSVSGQRLTFAVIDEREITYRVQAKAAGSWTFSGTWVDAVDKTEGAISPTAVTVGSGAAAAGAAPAGTGQAPGPTSAGGAPWAVVPALAAAAVAAGACAARKER